MPTLEPLRADDEAAIDIAPPPRPEDAEVVDCPRGESFFDSAAGKEVRALPPPPAPFDAFAGAETFLTFLAPKPANKVPAKGSSMSSSSSSCQACNLSKQPLALKITAMAPQANKKQQSKS
jgi:hypothetical protein